MDSFFNGVVATTAFFSIILTITLAIIQNRQYKRQQEEYNRLRTEERAMAEREARLKFLGDIAMDRNTPMKYRQPFYDEYKALGGNSIVEKSWLLELSEKQTNL